jgi:mono/diheme cytochrome c family protein
MNTTARPVVLVAALALSSLPLAAQAAAAPASRGEMLYANHCGACHTAQLHWRERRAATDWAGIRAQVLRWQGTLQLGWGEADIDEVARYLNQRFYRYPTPTERL